MALFEPTTILYFLANTGVDDYNKPYFDNDGAMYGWMQGHTAHAKTGCSYQRGDERPYISVNINYYDLLDCDMVMWQNTDTDAKWLYANITGLEWVNPNLTRVYFKIDAFCSFCGSIDWNNSYSLVEREHVENDWNGSVPNWDNIGVAEPINCDISRVTTFIDRTYTPDRIVVITPYAASGEVNIRGTTDYGVYSGLSRLIFQDASGVNEYLQGIAESDEGKLQNIVAVISLPSAFLNGTEGTVELTAPWAAPLCNNAKCYSSQFCNITIEGMLGSSQSYMPELLPASTTISFNYVCRFTGDTGGIVVCPSQYGGTMWPGNADIGFTINEFPQGAFVGDAYAEWKVVNGMSMLSRGINAVLGAATIAGVGLSGGAALPAVAGVSGMTALDAGLVGMRVANGASNAGSLVNVLRDYKAAKKGSALIGGNSGSASANLAAAVDEYGFKVRSYMPPLSELYAIDNFFDRYGYKVDRLKVPNRNNRPFWNFVKTSEGHIAGNMPSFYRIEIENMLNQGVTFWASGRTIGDYSNPAGNKG